MTKGQIPWLRVLVEGVVIVGSILLAFANDAAWDGRNERQIAEQQIAELECRIKRLEADAEEIVRGKLKNIEAEIIMLKRKVALLYQKSDQLDQFGLEDVVDVNGINVKRLGYKEEDNG